MRLDICSIGQILHWSAKKSRALQLQFPLVESVSNSQLVSQHLFLNFDSIRFESIVSQGWGFDEERKQSRAITRKMFFFSPPLVNFGRFHSWNRLSIFSLFPFPFIFFYFKKSLRRSSCHLAQRERERKRIRFTSSRIGKARWRTRFAKLGNRGVGRGSFLKRIKDTTLREHNLQPNLQVSCLFPRDLNDSRGRKNCFVKTSFASPSRDVSYLQRKLKTSNGRILIPNVAASSLFLASKHEDVYGNVVSLHLT